MFADSLLDVSWKDRSRRGYATLASFGLECLAVAFLLLIPLLCVQGLPRLRLAMASVPVPPAAPQPAALHPRSAQSFSNLGSDGSIIMPMQFPVHPVPIVDEGPILPPDPSQLGVVGSTGGPLARDGVFGSAGIGTSNVAPPPPIVAKKPPIISQLMDGYLIYRVQPSYPPLARQAHIQGTVILHAVISRDGRIEQLQLVSGYPMLVPSAMDAVKQWRYRPYLLNGEPVEVETQITVNFTLSGG